MVYPALLPLMHTSRLTVVYWIDATADLNGLVRFAEWRNVVSARVPSRFQRSLTPRGKVIPVYLPQFSEEDPYIKTIKIFPSSSLDNHTQRNIMADCSSLLCKTLGSSTLQKLFITHRYEILTDRHPPLSPLNPPQNGSLFFSFFSVLVICFRSRFHAVSRKDPQQFIAADFSSSFFPL